MKSLFKVFSIIFFVIMLVQLNPGMRCESLSPDESLSVNGWSFQKDVKFPWVYGGFTKEGEMHLRYFYFAREALEKVSREDISWEEAVEGRTGIVEVWFKKEGSLLRVDRYLEKLKRPCESFEGGTPETISYEGKIYTLFERVVQKGLPRTKYTLTSNSSTKVCSFKKQSHNERRMVDQKTLFIELTRGETIQSIFWLYTHHSDMNKQMDISGIEMAKLMKPAKHKKILDGWKDKKTIAGRETVRNSNAAPVFGGGEGFQYIDTKLGFGLMGYLEEFRDLDTGKKTKFDKSTLIYKALIVETAVSNDVFEGF